MPNEEDEKSGSLQRMDQPTSLLSIIAQAVADPRMDVEKMRAIFELRKDIEAEESRKLFVAAMTRLQAKLPPMEKYGKAKNSKFAKYEDIMAVAQPLIASEGFSVSFDEVERTDKTVTFAMEFSHNAGHAKTKRLTVHTDLAGTNQQGKGIRPPIQDDGSTVSYARRYLLKMHLNIVEKGEDTDGERREPITEEQARDLNAWLEEVKADRPRFLKYMGVERVEDILQGDYKKAVESIEAKRRGGK